MSNTGEGDLSDHEHEMFDFVARPPFNNVSSSSNIRNFYNNAAFNNSYNQTSQFGPPKPYIAPAVSDFMHEQEKMNQMIFEQLKMMNAKIVARNKLILEWMDYQTTHSQPHPGRLPSQPEVNSRGEVKAITLRSGTDYAPPALPPADHTDRTDDTRPVSDSPVEKPNATDRTNITRPTQMEKPEDTDRACCTRTVQNTPDAETKHPHRAESTRQAQPVQTSTDMDRVSVTRPVHISAEGQKTREADKPPPYRPPVPFPRWLAKTKLNEKFANIIQLLKQLHITIPFTDALTQIPTYILE